MTSSTKKTKLILLLVLVSMLISMVACIGSGISSKVTEIRSFPSATISFSAASLSALRALGTATGASGLSSNAEMTVTFASEPDDVRLNDFKVVGGTAISLTPDSATEYTLVVDWTANKGSIRIGNSTFKLVSFNDDIAPILNNPLTDGTNTNKSSCVYCHSSGLVTERYALIPTVCFGTARDVALPAETNDPAEGTGNCTTTFPKSSFDMAAVDDGAGGNTPSTWSAIPTVTHHGVTRGDTGSTTVDITNYDPTQSTLYNKITGNMPRDKTADDTVNTSGQGYQLNPVKATSAQAQLVFDWITQGAKNN